VRTLHRKKIIRINEHELVQLFVRAFGSFVSRNSCRDQRFKSLFCFLDQRSGRILDLGHLRIVLGLIRFIELHFQSLDLRQNGLIRLKFLIKFRKLFRISSRSNCRGSSRSSCCGSSRRNSTSSTALRKKHADSQKCRNEHKKTNRIFHFKKPFLAEGLSPFFSFSSPLGNFMGIFMGIFMEIKRKFESRSEIMPRNSTVMHDRYTLQL